MPAEPALGPASRNAAVGALPELAGPELISGGGLTLKHARALHRHRPARHASRSTTSRAVRAQPAEVRVRLNVSHELRTPLTNMKMYINLQKGRPDRRTAYMETAGGARPGGSSGWRGSAHDLATGHGHHAGRCGRRSTRRWPSFPPTARAGGRVAGASAASGRPTRPWRGRRAADVQAVGNLLEQRRLHAARRSVIACATPSGTRGCPAGDPRERHRSGIAPSEQARVRALLPRRGAHALNVPGTGWPGDRQEIVDRHGGQVRVVSRPGGRDCDDPAADSR
jgi:hypothetical protein